MKSIKDIMPNLNLDPRYQATLKEMETLVYQYPEIQDFIQRHQDQLDEAILANSFSKLNEYRLELEALKAGRPGQNPGFAPKLFINQGYIDVTYEATEAYLQRVADQKRQALIDNRMMSLDVRQASLSQVDLNGPGRQALMEAILQFIRQFKEDPRQAQGLYISGPFGVGKTYFLGALANEMTGQGASVSMIHYPTYASQVKAAISDGTVQAKIDAIKAVDILIIDDIGAEANSAWLRDEVLSVILEYRMKESLPTFFTSNFNVQEIQSHLATTRDSSDQVKAQRIIERIRYLARELELHGENRRHQGRN